MRLFSALVLVSSSVVGLACSIDTEQFTFAGAAGASVGGGSGAAGTSAGGAGTAGANAGGTSAGGTSAGGTSAGGTSAGGASAGAAGVAGAAGGGAGGSDTAGAAGEGGMAGAGGAGASGAAGAGAGGASDCNPDIAGLPRCTADGTSVETCDGTSWVPDATPCALGCNAKGVFTACKACAPGAFSCNGDTLEVCAADGSGPDVGKEVACGQTPETVDLPVCNAAAKACQQCKAGDTACSNGFVLTCSANGVFPVAGGKDCGGVGLCKDGACLVATCSSGEIRCGTKGVSYCLPDQSGFGVETPCATGETCDATLGCVACTNAAGATFCDGNTVTECVGGKKSVVAACGTGACVEGSGVAECQGCTLGTAQCAGQDLSICDGTDFVASKTCGPTESCNVALAACTECTAGETRCVGDTPQTCGKNGKYIAGAACGADLCNAKTGACDECNPDDVRCSATGELELCDSAQFVFVVSQQCASAALCNAKSGTCDPPACKVGDIKCAPGRQPQTCSPDLTKLVDSGPSCASACLDNLGCTDVVDVFAGGGQSCAIVDKKVRALVCWGQNNGAAGSGTLFGGASGEVAPRFAKQLTGVKTVELAPGSMCVTTIDNKVLCWGNNGVGQLGDGTTTNNFAPTEVPGLAGVTDLSLSQNAAVCAAANDKLFCWGQRLGVSYDTKPTEISTQEVAVGVAVGINFRCLIDQKAHASCWGDNGVGQLGNNTTSGSAAPTTLVLDNDKAPLEGVSMVDAAPIGPGTHACALGKGGVVSCWGSNVSLQLAAPSTTTSSRRALGVVNLDGSTLVSVGAGFSCAVKNGTPFCWGAGQLGQNGQLVNSGTPTPVGTLAGVTALDSGYAHTCALTSAGQVYCWGQNNVGQLGIPSGGSAAAKSATPVLVPMP